MKAFWALVAVMVIAAAILLARTGSGAAPAVPKLAVNGPGQPVAQRSPLTVPADAPTISPGKPALPPPAAADEPAAPAAGAGEAGSLGPAPEVPVGVDPTAVPAEATTLTPPAAIPVPEQHAPEGATPPEAPKTDAEPASIGEPAAEPATGEPAVVPPVDEPAPADPAPPEGAPAPDAAQAADANPAPAEAAALATDAPPAPKPEAVVKRDDGSLLVEGRWVVRGEGTAAKPYELPWELLVSVRDEYNPRQNKTTLPEWTKAFHEKRVRVTGYLLLPLAGEEFDEILIMRNQWDGCCIGVPPTAYDAVEVKLSQTVSLSRLNANYGSITGTFKVDPYLSGKWLIGLYVMDGGVLSDAGGRNMGGE